jgi:hypothetical protein
MLSSGILRCLALVKTDVSEEYIAFIIRVAGIGEQQKHATKKDYILFSMIQYSILYSISSLPASVACYLLRSYFADSSQPDDGSDMFLRSVGSYKNHTA